MVIKSSKAPTEYTLHIADPQNQLGDAHRQKDGSYVFDALIDGDVKLGLSAPMAYEQPKGSQVAAPPFDPHTAHMTVSKVNGGFDVTVAVDQAWLAGKTFPIVLDPSVNFETGDQGITVGFDANEPHYSCGGSCTMSQLGYIDFATDNTVDTVNPIYDNEPGRSFYRFDLSNIPIGSTVSDASFQTVMLFCQKANDSDSACPHNNYNVELHAMSAAWDHSTTWSTLAANTNPSAFSSLFISGAWNCFWCYQPEQWGGLGSTVQGWVNQPWTNFGFSSKLQDESPGVGGIGWAFAHQQYYTPSVLLKVTYTPPPVASTQLTGGGNPASNLTACSATSNPVNCATGSFWHSVNELSVPGRGVPLDFGLTYDASMSSSASPLGFGWTSPYNMNMINEGNVIGIKQENGSLANFNRAAGGCGANGVGFATPVATGNAGNQSLAVDCNGHLWAWGQNNYGQVGDGTTTDRSSPTQLNGLGNVIGTAGGVAHSLAIVLGGIVYDWGDNTYGELGNGSTTQSLTPVAVSGGGNMVAVAGGYDHSLALRSDGTVWAWGLGLYGELGNGGTSNSSVPVQVPGLSGVTAIAATSFTSLALKSDGTVWAWGFNGYGEVGDGTTTNRPSPVQVFSGAASIAGGFVQSIAVKSDGTVWDWGYNGYGELGNGTTTNSSVPVQASGLSGITAVSSGDYFTMALKNDGTVWAWGDNSQGELGNGSTANSSTPVLSGGGYNVFVGAIAAGGYHALTEFTATCPTCIGVASWGLNSNGQLGDGTTAPTNSLQIPSFGGNYIARPGGGFVADHVLAVLAQYFDGTTLVFRRTDHRWFEFNPSGQLTYEFGLNGYATTISYSNGQVSTVTDPEGRSLSFAYQGGLMQHVSDPAGRTVTLSYDGADRLTGVTDVGGGTTQFAYYQSSNLVQTMKRPRQVGVVTNTYDSSNRVVQQSDELGRVTAFDYTSIPGATKITDPQGNVTVQHYQNYELTSVTKGYGTPSAATWSYQYDPLSLGVTQITDPNQHVTAQTWDPKSGNIASATDPLNHTMSQTWDPVYGFVTSRTDAKGVTTSFTYDGNFNLLGQSTPLLNNQGQVIATQTTTNQYGQDGYAGDRTTTIDPDGNHWTKSYDSYGDLTSQTDPLGDETTYAYGTPTGCGSGTNGIGLRTAMVSARGNVTGGNPATYTTTYQHNCFGDVTVTRDPLWSSASPNQHQAVSTYDADRNLALSTDGDSHTTSYAYDAADELTVTTRPDATTLKTDYNGDGTVKDQVDGGGNMTSYGYDPLARVASVTDPLNRTTAAGYDGAGNLLMTADPGGTCVAPKVGCTSRTYDAANELVGIAYSDGTTPNVTNGYDGNGRRTTMTDGTGTSTYAHDTLGRLISATSGSGGQVQYGYDLNNNTTTITYPGSLNVTRGYDSAGRLTRVTDWFGNATRFAYDADSNQRSTTFPSTSSTATLVDTTNFDAASQLMGITDTTQSPGSQTPTTYAAVAYQRDGAGLLTSEAWTGAIQSSQSYGYTSLEQIGTAPAGSYAYDHSDNTTQIPGATSLIGQQAPTTADLGYDTAGQLCWAATATGTSCASPPASATTFSYDARGDRTAATPSQGTAAAYSYDQERRLTSVSAPTAATYAYNGDGLRMSKTAAGVATHFTWDTVPALPRTLVETTPAGTNDYVYGPGGLPVEQVNPDGSVAYIHHDQQGSTRLLTDGSGVVRATYSFDVFGSTTSHSGSASTSLLYAGQYRDAETNFYYLRARYYDPASAQFLSRDPMVAFTRSSYGYAGGNPLNATDPSGECGLWGNDTCWGAIGGFAGNVVHVAIDVVTDPFYLTYWGSYSLASGINQLGSRLGLPGSIISHIISAPLAIPEATGLGVDALGDSLKSLFVPGYLGVGDEGATNRGPDCKGPYLLGSQLGPFLAQHGFDWRAPGGRFPGVDQNGHVDFEW